MLKVYSFNWATREYNGEDVADPNPLEPGTWLMPAYSTTKEPPEVAEGKRAVWDLEKEEWTIEDILPPKKELTTFKERYAAIPTYDLFGSQMIGDLFNGQ